MSRLWRWAQRDCNTFSSLPTLQAELYTPMSFKAFPFDTQYLSVQLQYGDKYPESPVNIVPSGEVMLACIASVATALKNIRAGCRTLS